MKLFKKLAAVVCAATLALSMAACTKNDAPPANSSNPQQPVTSNNDNVPKDKKIVIGYSVYWMSEFTTLMTDAMKKHAQELGVELLIADGNMDPQKQLSQCENFISQKVDVIICAPIDRDAIVPAIEKAKENGIPYVGINMFVRNGDVSAYAGPDDVKAGELAAQYVVDQLQGKGKVIVIEGGEGFSATEDRRQGIKNVLDKNSGIEILAQKTANWSRDDAVTLMENYIQSFGDEIQGVITHNDEMALGALTALQAKNMNNVYIGAIDAIKDALVVINDGVPYATVFQDPVVEGNLGIDIAVKLAKGESIDEKDNFIDMTLVTKDNVSNYLN